MLAVADPVLTPEVATEVNGNEVEDESSQSVVGVIYPPPDVRTVVDKAASFVARNGVQFEERIREKSRAEPKFSFLNPNDPYHAYYQLKIKEFKEGKVPTQPAPKFEEEPEIIQSSPKIIPKEPAPFEFICEMPAISAQDLDILKLTAQFVARNGRQFMNALAQREQRNYQFDFLRPNHSLFNYFTKLVEQYTRVLLPPKDLNSRLKDNAENKYQVIDRVMERVEYVTYMEAEKKKAEDEEERERLAYATIDWHDFVIVETVEFLEADENMEFPPPMSLTELESMTLAQKKMASMFGPEETVEDKSGDVDMEMDDDVDMEDDDGSIVEVRPPDASGPIKVRKDYVPKALAGKSNSEATSICPLCNQAIPASELDEHVRIELLDPRWKEQKEAAEAKRKESNLLQEGTDVGRYLKNFAGFRSDMFGNEEVGIGQRVGEDAAKQKEAEKNKVIWDGHTTSINIATQRAQAGTSFEEQIANIHRSKGLIGEAEHGIGPQIPNQPGMAQQPPVAYPYGQPPMPGGIPPPPGVRPMYPGYPYSQPVYPGMPPQPVMYPGQGFPPNGPGIPPPPPMANFGRPGDEEFAEGPDSKKLKAETSLFVSADEWLSTHPGPLTLTIQTPAIPDKSEWKLTGESFTLEGLELSSLVSELKQKIADTIGMPSGRQKITTPPGKTTSNIPMKNQLSLAYYNIQNGDTLILGIKERGGRK
ncbi:SF3a splicing factor complex subunit [Basidiobolus ranarum]|uniref:SF3a splicing factor complex subunit n=1 Tax=Basidiobolus ranarum TaxID=34480 RepID=A0ABR2W787_9FUNG